MSRAWREATKTTNVPTTDEVMRIHCQRPGRVDGDGNILYTTEQAPKDICDVNNIIKQYDKTGLIINVSNFEAKFGDLSGMDFKTMQDTIAGAKNNFRLLPAEIRKRFKNDPMELLKFMEDENNRDEAIELGLISKDWTPESDGIGEHVKLDENVIDDKDKPVEEE